MANIGDDIQDFVKEHPRPFLFALGFMLFIFSFLVARPLAQMVFDLLGQHPVRLTISIGLLICGIFLMIGSAWEKIKDTWDNNVFF